MQSLFTATRHKWHLFAIFLTLLSVHIQAQTHTIILGRPTDKAITVNVLFDKKVDFYIEYGTSPNVYDKKTINFKNELKLPDEIELTALSPDTKYFYRLNYKLLNESTYMKSTEYSFHTQRSPGSTFLFTLEADEHLYDKKGVRSLYKIALANQALDKPDFMLSLGDIFGDDHTPDETTSEDMDLLHKDYLQYLGAICHSIPFYVCLGNHEGESGYYLSQKPGQNIAHYGTYWRKLYYPNPYPNEFYSGNMVNEGNDIGLPENYYAWTWGDALFVVLDVYRHCDVNEKPQNWDWTLGKTQYDWFKQTLESSKAKQKFVFAHHTRGQGRGAKNTAKGYEWGGYSGNNASNYQFDQQRPGWGKPIHQLMVDNGVKIFFQGHDHLFAKEELDGLVYQEVPMPSDSTYEIGVLANADAYTDVTLDGSGHLRVTVNPSCVKVDFVRAYLPKDTIDGKHSNREVAYSYTIGACTSATEDNMLLERDIQVYPSPASSKVTITVPSYVDYESSMLSDAMGRNIANTSEKELDLDAIKDGIYFLTIKTLQSTVTKKIIVSHQ